MALPFAALAEISIHAPRTGSDDDPIKNRQEAESISIHAPRTGSDKSPCE